MSGWPTSRSIAATPRPRSTGCAPTPDTRARGSTCASSSSWARSPPSRWRSTTCATTWVAGSFPCCSRSWASKFAIVVLWFMHLKFDDRRYSRFFMMGLAGASTLYLIVLISLRRLRGPMINLPAWHAHPDVWLLFGSIVAAYVIAGRRHAAETGEPVDRRKTAVLPDRHRGAVAGRGLADPRPGGALPLPRPHGAAHPVHAGRAAVADRGDAGVAPPSLPATQPVADGVRLPDQPDRRADPLQLRRCCSCTGPPSSTLSVSSEWAHFGLHLLLVSTALADVVAGDVAAARVSRRSPRPGRCSTCSCSRSRRRSPRRS